MNQHRSWSWKPGKEATERALLGYLNGLVGKRERTEALEIRTELPKTMIGKPSRKALSLTIRQDPRSRQWSYNSALRANPSKSSWISFVNDLYTSRYETIELSRTERAAARILRR